MKLSNSLRSEIRYVCALSNVVFPLGMLSIMTGAMMIGELPALAYVGGAALIASMVAFGGFLLLDGRWQVCLGCLALGGLGIVYACVAVTAVAATFPAVYVLASVTAYIAGDGRRGLAG